MDKYFPHHSRGFSLIEVLITLLLTSVGILGMAAMQAKAIAYTQDSIQRNTAAMLADELMEILRADQSKIIAVDGQPRGSSDYYYLPDSDENFPLAAATCNSLSNGGPTERLGCWAKRASQALPGVTPELLKSDFYIQPQGAAIEIQLAWSVAKGACMDGDNSADKTVCHYRLRAEL